MPRRTSTSGSELFIVDNSEEDWKVLRYLRDWCELSKSIDIATGYFEIGSLLALDDQWQKVDSIRILMGDEVSKRTKKAFEQGLRTTIERLDASIEEAKCSNDFLTGVPSIVDALKAKKIQCRVYRKDKFHAKCYLTHARQEVVGSFGLVGSSNFTHPGITQNLELNVQITGSPVAVLQEWYEEHWENAEDVTPEILKTIERHTQFFSPFEVYAKSLQEYFKGHELTAGQWERQESTIYRLLADYQKEGYHALLKNAQRHNGAFLCDGVGLGKTFIGLMLIERMVKHERKKVALFVPKSGREAVWEFTLRKYLPELFGRFNNLEIFNHTDLLRENMQQDLQSVRDRADVVVIDEAHHFRNTGKKGDDPGVRKSRYWKLYDLIGDKTVFHLTATPVNNGLIDFQHMAELFTRHKTDYFSDAPLGIHSLSGHIRKLERDIQQIVQRQSNGASTAAEQQAGDDVDVNQLEAEQVFNNDALFRSLVVQRSRSYVVESMQNETGGQSLFPKPRDPKVANYSVAQTYGKLLGMVERAFTKDKPLFSLAIYYPLAYYTGDDETIDPFAQNRQKQVVALIRTNFLKRFESSAEAFKQSCWNLLYKLLAWVEVHAETKGEKSRIERWKHQHAELIDLEIKERYELFDDEDDLDEDVVPPEMLEAVEQLDREEYDVSEIINETLLDLDQVAEFLEELEKFKPKQDKKLTALLKLLQKDKVLSKNKVLIFSEFMTTARYLKKQLIAAGIEGVEEIDSGTNSKGRIAVIRRFAPYYNGSSNAELAAEGLDQIRVLISTDVLSEGLNLQDATRLINYDIHWNPVRLMQRIGRVDRRMNPDIEAQIIADNPEQKKLRGEVAFWNFLPPDELNTLLSLYRTVTRKTLLISEVFGIEGGKLLSPDDDLKALKNFTERYYGTKTPEEEMHLEYQRMLKDYPELEQRLTDMPQRIFSGKKNDYTSAQAIFFCFARPAEDHSTATEETEPSWTLEAGDVAWYLYDISSKKIIEEPTQIIEYIRSTEKTKRICKLDQGDLTKVREQLDKHLKNTYLKKVQAPVGVKPVLRAWMELN